MSRPAPERPIELLTPEQAADALAVSVRTLQDWRYRKIGPAFIRAPGRTIRYRRSDLARWVEVNTIRTGGAA